MKVILLEDEKDTLESQHKKERDSRISDRIKAVLLRSEGWSQTAISQVLRISEKSVYQHLIDYTEDQKLKPMNGGSSSSLDEQKTSELISHLEAVTYDKVETICAYIEKRWGINYSASGMTNWLHNNGFSYKQPKGTPSKANKVKQEEFHREYIELMEKLPANAVVEFADGVHPTMSTKISHGWIRRGYDKLISTTASKTRMNLFGSINLSTMSLTIDSYDTINSDAIEKHFKRLKDKYPAGTKIHMILDQGSYNTSNQTKSAAEENGIILHHLPPYSPNLNPIERLWKVMNEYVRNNTYFASTKDFKRAILSFFQDTWLGIKDTMRSRINDNFQTL